MAILPLFTNSAPYPDEYAGQKRDRAQMFAPPANLEESNSSAPAQATATSKAPAPVGFVKDKSGAFVANKEKMTPAQGNVLAGMYGAEAGAQVRPTESAAGSAIQTLGAGAQGAAAGFMAGGPAGALVGGGVGLLMGGLNAFVGNQQARKERDRVNSMNREAEKIRKENVARDEKWRQTYLLRDLEQARYERRKYESQAAFERAQVAGKSMQAKIQNNSVLKDRFAKLGYA